ncbi:MAG: glycosyltransferase family 9 protein [Sphingobacteriales bacterium]|nr:glycosyltransferase family 9 protein [Sphingobacteriales bacterium]
MKETPLSSKNVLNLCEPYHSTTFCFHTAFIQFVIPSEKRLYFASMLLSRSINGFKKAHCYDFKRILVVRLDEIGDMIVSLPAFEALRHRYPKAHITLLCKSFVKSIVAPTPYFDRIVEQVSELNSSSSYDLIVEMRGTWETLHFAQRHRPDIRLDRGTVRFYNKLFQKQHPHEVFTNLQVLQPLFKTQPLPADPQIQLFYAPEHLTCAERFLQQHRIGEFAVFHIGARKALRRWSIQRFAEVAAYLKKNYHWYIVWVGDATEQSDIEAVRQLLDFETFSFAGVGGLMDYAALVRRAHLMLGNESGPMHIAAAAGAPTIGLFGPGEPHIFAPFGKKATFIHHKLHCNPCTQLHCVSPERTCMSLISVAEVLEKIRQLQTSLPQTPHFTTQSL